MTYTVTFKNVTAGTTYTERMTSYDLFSACAVYRRMRDKSLRKELRAKGDKWTIEIREG